MAHVDHKIDCVVCKGVGKLERPYQLSDEAGMKKVCAIKLREHGYSIRQIAKFLGYSSPSSVQVILDKNYARNKG